MAHISMNSSTKQPTAGPWSLLDLPRAALSLVVWRCCMNEGEYQVLYVCKRLRDLAHAALRWAVRMNSVPDWSTYKELEIIGRGEQSLITLQASPQPAIAHCNMCGGIVSSPTFTAGIDLPRAGVSVFFVGRGQLLIGHELPYPAQGGAFGQTTEDGEIYRRHRALIHALVEEFTHKLELDPVPCYIAQGKPRGSV